MIGERRSLFSGSNFETREAEDGAMFLDCYFSVYDSIYNIGPGMSESIAPGAFVHSMQNDIRALINHDDTLVIGRTSAGTLTLRDDAHGLFGSVLINPNDTDATNLYARVKRGDVSGCSIGFIIRNEETTYNADGSVHWKITDVDLIECSVVTFPAYEDTSAKTRAAERDEYTRRKAEEWRNQMKVRLNHGA